MNFFKTGRDNANFRVIFVNSKKVLLVARLPPISLMELVNSKLQYITQNIREIGGAFRKNYLFSTISLYFRPSLSKIRALPPYEIYVSGQSKTWANRCKKVDEFALKLKIL